MTILFAAFLLDLVFGNRIQTLYSSVQNLEDAVLDAELVIGGVLIPGASAPKLVTRAMVESMKKGAVVVDVFSRTPSALAQRRRGPAVLEDRGESAVPAQRH
jgi:NAD/NADP transhydrogenase alpha subunit